MCNFLQWNYNCQSISADDKHFSIHCLPNLNYHQNNKIFYLIYLMILLTIAVEIWNGASEADMI